MSDTDTTEPRPLDQLATALAAFQAEMPTVAKTKTAQVKSDKGSYSYTYAGLADVSEAAMPLLSKHGLSFSTLPEPGVLTGMLLHQSGQYLTASLPIGGGTPQAVGSSLTYMRRYLLGCMTGLVTDDDDDGQTAEASARKRRAAPTPPPAAPVQRPRPAPEQAEPAGDVRTEAQSKRLFALLHENGLEDRDTVLAWLTELLGRPVETTKTLTKHEASRAMDALAPEPPDAEEPS
jgi:hypothetical protein